MPNRTGHEDIAINILDYLFLHDVATMSTFSDAKNIFYPDFLGTLDGFVAQRFEMQSAPN